VTTIPLLQQVRAGKQYSVVASPATTYEFLRFNTFSPPFNNIVAREAIAYATNSKSLITNLYDNFYKPVESPSAPGELFYEATVPGARTYNLAKATALVQQLGGLSVQLTTFSNTEYWTQEASALASQWEAAGIKVTIIVNSLATTLVEDLNHNYQVTDINWGGVDNGIQLPNFWETGGHSSGVNDPVIDGLLNQGVQFASPATRAKVFLEIAERISKEQYGVFLYSKSTFSIITKNVEGYTNASPEIHYESVWMK